MVSKITIPLLFICAQLIIAWYGAFTGKLPIEGTYLGISYRSALLRSLLIQLEYLWVLVLINVLFSLGFTLGYTHYSNFLSIATIWIGSGAVAALIVNAFLGQAKLDLPVLVGLFFVTIGAILVIAHAEIAESLGAWAQRALTQLS